VTIMPYGRDAQSTHYVPALYSRQPTPLSTRQSKQAERPNV